MDDVTLVGIVQCPANLGENARDFLKGQGCLAFEQITQRTPGSISGNEIRLALAKAEVEQGKNVRMLQHG